MTTIRSLAPARLLGVLGFSFALAACASTETMNTGHSSAGSNVPAKQTHSAQGSIWTTADGMSLYTFARDEDGRSNCNGGCAAKWPPLSAAADAVATGDFSIIRRNDGSKQWALRGAPLYRWIKDKKAGDLSGHGVKNVWFAARADDAPVSIFKSGERTLLTDSTQRTLYTFDKDGSNQSNCYQKCATLWPPLLAEPEAKASGPYAVIQRKDGTSQWALNGQPLYTWVKDSQPGDTSGDGIKGVWRLAAHP